MHTQFVQLGIARPTASVRPSERMASAVASFPRLPQGHLFESELGPHLLVTNGSRVYGIGLEFAAAAAAAMSAGDSGVMDALLSKYGLDAPPYIEDQAPESFPIRALSLAVAQKCNLGCTYCYAEGGDFGGPSKSMSLEVARASVRRLLDEVAEGESVTLAFMGGEPLINRPVLRAATEYAIELGAMRDIRIGFSITTNGTLLTADDGEFFERHGFAVTVSLDGIGATHDQQRSFIGGQGSYDRILERVTPLLAMQRQMQISARVTVTPGNMSLRETLDAFIRLGFHSVGFSPMLNSPTGQGTMHVSQLEVMLQQMIDCGHEFERQLIGRRRYPFSNMVSALKEIHKGTHRPYPCGAGAGYFGVSADGQLSACHRFVGDPVGAMGNLADGVDRSKQATWLARRHVHTQDPCGNCWARYLCGGGCHHEVIERGRPACDYIRGWLHYCLQAYVRLMDRRPDFFGEPVATASC